MTKPPDHAAHGDGSRIAFTVEAVAQRAADFLEEYRAAIADIPPEAGFGGIWESEMLLFCAAIKPYAPKQILESGRSRGKSTTILARCFPEAQIISSELDPHSPNAAVAKAKLEVFPNVTLLWGDSHKLLPEHLQPGDAVLIDGPKDFRAIELALTLLRTGKPCAVFLHDFPPSAPGRRFIARNWPEAFFGDASSFHRFRSLDDERDPRSGARARGYGTFACLPAALPAPYWQLKLKMRVARLTGGIGAKANQA
jgi:hypothetical protein